MKILQRIVVKFQDHLNMPYGSGVEINDFLIKNNIISWDQMNNNFSNINVSKLFTSLKPDKILEMVNTATKSDPNYKAPNFFTYFAIDCPDGMDTNNLLAELWKNKNIQYAYKQSGFTDPPTVLATNNRSSKWQKYLDPAPVGIDAKFAWNVNGGDGTGKVGFIDIERGWDLLHNDLPQPPIKLLSGENYDNFDHGTGVLGIILAQDNDTGCVGITPHISVNKVGVISQARPRIGRRDKVFHSTDDQGLLVNNTEEAIMGAIDALAFGDVLLLEIQILSDIVGAKSLFPCEVESSIFEVIKLATVKGIIVIEAAGNGTQDLDSFKDDSAKFVLNRNNATDFKDSGAIMVGSSSSDAPHARDGSSNFGNRIDCYAWGENIKTTGNSSSTKDSTTGYTSTFNGTSGASAIVAGAVISIQSMKEASSNTRYGPNQMREILRNLSNGTPSVNPNMDSIGQMPDLKKIKINEIGG